MEPIKFSQSNKTLGRPSSMTEEECSDLTIYSDGEQCISLWKMSWRERFSALFYGHVWLYVFYGRTQPPVALSVKKDIFEDKG